MTCRLTILILLTSSVTWGQDNLALINDRDGFTNVRQGRSRGAVIVGQIKQGEFFTFKGTNDDWWEIEKTYDENGTAVNLTGFVHRSRIQSISDLPDKDKRQLLKDIFDKELKYIKTENWKEREKHHEPKFDIVLNLAIEYITRTKDEQLLRTFIETVKLDTGSADEMPSWTLGSIFVKQPDWTIAQMKVVGLDQHLVDLLEFGFENVSDPAGKYAKLKKKIDALNEEPKR